MGATVAVHPADPILQAYGLGKLDDASSASVSQHLESCDPCQRRVAELSSDEFLGRLQQAGAIPDKAASGWSPSATVSNDEAERPVVPPPPADTLPPELVDHADWEIVRELGRGGMGVVYLAKNRLMGRMEVLKVVGRHLIERPGVFERFLREIQSAARLQHVNVVTAYTAMRLGSSLVFAMEYVDGRDLMMEVKSKGPLPIAHAAYFIHQAALGLQHAHERGMVHRDIKPANLILARDGKKAIVKVLDFGLAKVTSEGESDSNLTREGQMVGTPDFIAPEQIRDARSADIRADIYSLGCTLYYLLTGVPPFRRQHLFDVYKAHESAVATPLNLVRPEVPVELAAVAAKMMAKEPGRRFQTPAQVAQALVPFFKTTGSTAQKPAQEIAPTTQPTRQSRPVETPTAPTQAGTVDSFTAAPVAQASPQSQREEPKWESLIEFKETEPLTEIAPRPAAVPKVPRRAQMWLAAVAAVVVLGLLGAWVALDNRANTPNGNRGRKVSPKSSERVAETDPVIHGAPTVTKPPGEPSPAIVDSTGFTVLSGKWHVERDELIQTDASKWSSAIIFGDDRWTDYHLAVDFMREEGKGGVGVCFRSTDGNRAYVGFSLFEEKDCEVIDHNHGFEHWLKSANMRIVSRKWYTAHVHVRGDLFVCSLYDQESGRDSPVPDFTDHRHPRGRVGLETFGSGVRFKNIKVTSPHGKVLWEGLPAVEATKETESPKLLEHPALAPGSDGFVQLFNGIDLQGWNPHPSQRGNWHIENGILVGSGPGAVSHLYTIRDDYKDFHLHVEVRINDAGNGGVWARSSFGPTLPVARPERPHGYQIQILGRQAASRNTGTLFAGGRAPAVDVRESPAPSFKWFDLDVRAEGERVTVMVNGKVTADYTDVKWPFSRGHIALGQYGGESVVEFRKIEIKKLSSASRALVSKTQTATPEKVKADPSPARQGFVPLFNGNDIEGWTAWGRQGRLIEADAAGIWWVRDGILHGKGGLSSLFSPRGDYKNFRIRAQAMINDGGNSGLILRVAEGPGHRPAYEAQINSTHKDPNKTGSLYRVPLPPISVNPSPVPPDKWFTLRIEVIGARIRIWVNDTPYVDWTDQEKTYTQGHIAIQAHHPGSHVQIRKLEIMELDETGKPIAAGAVSEGGEPAHKSPAKANRKSSNRSGRGAANRPPADATEFHGKFYKVFPHQLSWHQAQLTCQGVGGHLAVVKSEDENQFLMSLMKHHGISVVWLGATDEKAEGTWVWVDGEPLRYSNWNPGQPNNKQDIEHYMIMIAGNPEAVARGALDGKWHDQPNEPVQWSPGLICQWD